VKTDVYLYLSGSLKRADHSLVHIHNETKRHLPIGQIRSLFVFGHIDFDRSVISLLNDHDIPVLFFSYFGRYLGKYLPVRKRTGDDVVRHALFVSDIGNRKMAASKIIRAAAENMLFVLKYYHKKDRIGVQAINGIEACLDAIREEADLERLMLLEADTKRIYYSVFDAIILEKSFVFGSRSMYPPSNAVNAMMSFGYALLYAKLEGDIHRSRLMPELPFVHGLSKAGSALQHDVADLFKPIFIDRLIFSMINKRMITLGHFEQRDNGVFMTRDGMGVMISQLDASMKRTVPIKGKHHSYRGILTREVHEIANMVFEGKSYRPFVMTRW
jgi:CRISP-associated protein Cas1